MSFQLLLVADASLSALAKALSCTGSNEASTFAELLALKCQTGKRSRYSLQYDALSVPDADIKPPRPTLTVPWCAVLCCIGRQARPANPLKSTSSLWGHTAGQAGHITAQRKASAAAFCFSGEGPKASKTSSALAPMIEND